MIKFDGKKIQNSMQFDTLINDRAIKSILRKNIDLLYYNNKNYTKKQWNAIEELKTIIDGIKD